ncbi:tetratricopeptide repeat protein [Desulfofundulus thermobenzoicus]|uniref:Tetratricopeptide repeat protein n=1 Tax=Desulfofundulus thermobenzoicus TaxID=29376 RepID=A0A6N7IP93_9FIRM|nr:tetratricopeptide repeat protein [Desulfofundulus thermobenzoicus]MQL51397.1 tetratricopeptide repeat protein [Desulfofundulus thermobenzoicus]
MGKKARRKKTISLVANDIAQVPSNKLQATKKSVVHPSNPVALAAASVACAAVFLFAFFLASANGYARQAGEYLQRGNVQQGLAAMQKAAAYNPFSADYHTGLMRIYLATGKTRQAVEEAGAAAARSQYGAARQADLAQAYLAAGRYADAVTCARRALELAPYQIAWYETLAGICAAAGRGELQAGNKDAARQHLEEALQVPGMLQARVAGLGEEEKKLWRDAPMLAVTPRLQLGVGQAGICWASSPKRNKACRPPCRTTS